MRDRLIELIKPHISGTACLLESGSCELTNCRDCKARRFADHLIENGVILPPCKVGDMVYVVCRSHFSKNASIREQKATHLKYINGYWYIDTDTHFDKEYGLSVFTNYEEAEKALKEKNA